MPPTTPLFRKILVANRGEIARRLFRACRELGIPSVAVYSDADADAPWLLAADEALPLGGVTAAESYLASDKLLAAARQAGADAIHPGYGFLSENALFAAACADAGVTFIGPSPQAIYALGSKARARELAQRAGVPVTPGIDGGGRTPAELAAAADGLGYPLLIKASAGGGGKGMRVVWQAADFADALRAARSEAHNSFGDDHVILERYFTAVHHVEVQVLGDVHGHLIHLFERECSIQRRHQKIIEETPAPCLTPALRTQITAAAVALAREAGYSNAGTVEFMVTDGGEFFFLEMNTRLQVEHPITELVTGLDLAIWQIRLAAGQPLTVQQAAVRQRGHAIECRIYAEDPANGFLPSIGTLTHYALPTGPGIRVDDGLAAGSAVTPYYDPMIAKLIVAAEDRPAAIARMQAALAQTQITGVTTNCAYLQAILAQPRFRRGDTPTAYLAQEMVDWQPPAADDEQILLAIAAFEALHGRAAPPAAVHAGAAADAPAWRALAGFRNSGRQGG